MALGAVLGAAGDVQPVGVVAQQPHLPPPDEPAAHRAGVPPRPARAICHGGRGQIRQEDRLAALGLVLNAVVLRNTRFLDAAVAAHPAR